MDDQKSPKIDASIQRRRSSEQVATGWKVSFVCPPDSKRKASLFPHVSCVEWGIKGGFEGSFEFECAFRTEPSRRIRGHLVQTLPERMA